MNTRRLGKKPTFSDLAFASCTKMQELHLYNGNTALNGKKIKGTNIIIKVIDNYAQTRYTFY
ncbi:MAG: hypothetical protein IKQ12_03750 [Prevotella sp.]|nr:hypothetical protein [Prevotella sp.]